MGSLKSVLSWDIIHKLKTQRQILVSDEITDTEKWNLKRNEQSENRYRAILSNILSHGRLDKYQTELDNYRTIHNIDDDEHYKALKKCGWTPEEYELGHRVDDQDVFEDGP